MNEEENVKKEETNEEYLTFEQLLEDKDYKAEYDRKVAGLRAKWQEEWAKQAEEQKKEAERLGKLSAEERYKEQLEALNQREQELNLRELKNQTVDLLARENLPTSFAEYIVSTNSKAEDIQEAIKGVKEVYNNEIQEAVKRRLAGEAPKNQDGGRKFFERKTLN